MFWGKKKCEKGYHKEGNACVRDTSERGDSKRDKNLNCSIEKNKKILECKSTPRPLINYFGGKQRVADKIISQFPDHKVYSEPFVGGGAIYWKNTLPEKYMINDLNKDIYNLYKDAKSNPSKVKKCDLNNMNKEKWKKIKSKPDNPSDNIYWL